jgi:aspartate aminotransferase-like enzyme
MLENHLLAPGPTPIPESARLEMAKSIIHHRGPEFKDLFAETQDRLKWLFETGETVLSVTASGTGTFEAAMTNFTSPEDVVVSIGGGKFGERWADVARSYGMEVIELDLPWGDAIEPEQLANILDEYPNCSMVTLTASETSTGVLHPVKELAEVVRDKSDALFAVDGITAVGVHRLPMDDWDIDILVAGSQKAFGVPPGLGFIAANERTWERAEESTNPHYYFDLQRELGRQKENQTAFTPAISVFVALKEVLRLMQEEGRQQLIERHKQNASAVRSAIRALDLELLSDHHSNAVTAVKTPTDIHPSEIVETMRHEYQSVISGGQKHFGDKLFRIGHIGFYDRSDMMVAVSSLEMALEDLGYDFDKGAGIQAVQRVYSE